MNCLGYPYLIPRDWLLFFLIIIGCGCGSQDAPSAAGASSVQVMGLPTARMNYHVAEQQASNWCWAAAIQMVLSAQGIDVSQQQVVERAFQGRLVDRPGSAREILLNLNGRMRDRSGTSWHLEALPGLGPPSFELMQTQFERNLPLIVGYHVPGQSVGHAAVMTAVIYEQRAGRPHVLKILVRDPSPLYSGSGGKRELSRAEFDQIFVHYLVIPSQL